MKCGNEYSIASASTPMGSGCFVRVKPDNPVVKPPKFPPLPAVLHPDRIPKWVTTHVSDPRQITFLQASFEGWPVTPFRWSHEGTERMVFAPEYVKIRHMCDTEAAQVSSGNSELQSVYDLFKRAGWRFEESADNLGWWMIARPEDFALEIVPAPERWFSNSRL